jgi:glycosyltransferase involved in cell wall biosynthesis
MPKALVIIAAKNAAAWLSQCVQSIATQRLPPGWELGVVIGIDSCPPTLALATQIDTPGVAIRYFPEHVGPYVIFNSLAWASKPDVLIRFDSDDVMLQGYLSEQIQLLDPGLAPTIVQTWSVYVDPYLRPCQAVLANGALTGPDGHRPQASDGQFLITSAVFERLGGFRGWPCQADSEFLQRASWSRIPKKVVPKYLYLRRVHQDSLTVSKTTGYYSRIRHRYSQQIYDACSRYARGDSPEWVYPATARYAPVGRLPLIRAN